MATNCGFRAVLSAQAIDATAVDANRARYEEFGALLEPIGQRPVLMRVLGGDARTGAVLLGTEGVSVPNRDAGLPAAPRAGRSSPGR